MLIIAAMSSKTAFTSSRFHLDCQDFSNRKTGSDLLSAWMQRQLTADRGILEWKIGDPRVTVLAYYFWDQDIQCMHLDALECALLETWRLCGQMRSVIVTHCSTPGLERLGARHGDWLDIQVEPLLEPGNLYSMSVDCNSRLHQRFDTDYVLIIQEDGFPLRSGLDAYVGRYDFIGAPYVRNKWLLQAVCSLLKCRVCNGGFSLRSHRICELAAGYWNRKYHQLPDCKQVSEDLFYTKTLPMREPAFRRQVTLPTFEEANDFSYDAVFPYVGARPPFGFHGALAFKLLYEAGAVEHAPGTATSPGSGEQ